MKQSVESESELVDGVYASAAGIREGISYLKEMPKKISSSASGETFQVGDEKTFFSSKDLNRINRTLGSLLDLNVYNASTFACDGLLNHYPLEEPVKREFHIHYYELPKLPYVKASALDDRREELLPKLLSRLKRKVKKDFSAAFQTGWDIIFPFKFSVERKPTPPKCSD
jgi:hypothetical protein